MHHHSPFSSITIKCSLMSLIQSVPTSSSNDITECFVPWTVHSLTFSRNFITDSLQLLFGLGSRGICINKFFSKSSQWLKIHTTVLASIFPLTWSQGDPSPQTIIYYQVVQGRSVSMSTFCDTNIIIIGPPPPHCSVLTLCTLDQSNFQVSIDPIERCTQCPPPHITHLVPGRTIYNFRSRIPAKFDSKTEWPISVIYRSGQFPILVYPW